MISKREEDEERYAAIAEKKWRKEQEQQVPLVKPLIVSLVGGPGAGKSTTAAFLFGRLKKSGVNAEFVHEVAKDFTWEERWMALSSQPYVISKQLRNYDRLTGKVDVIITDTSPLLAHIYLDPGMMSSRTASLFLQYVESDWRDRKTLNVVLQRNESYPYQQAGRSQSENEAKALDGRILEVLRNNNFPHMTVPVQMDSQEHVTDIEEEIMLQLEQAKPRPNDIFPAPRDFAREFTGGGGRAHY